MLGVVEDFGVAVLLVFEDLSEGVEVGVLGAEWAAEAVGVVGCDDCAVELRGELSEACVGLGREVDGEGVRCTGR